MRALKQELVALEACQSTLEEELAATQAPPLLIYRQRVEQLQEALQDPGTRDQAFELIRSLIEEIRLVPDGSTLRIELKGELAGILALSTQRKKPGGLSAAGLTGQIKMVAGRGFEPLTFRL